MSSLWSRIVLISSCLAIGLTSGWLYAGFNNSLKLSSDWRATKAEMQMTLLGSRAFYTSRQSLANRQLDLGRWHGFQEVLTRMSFLPTRVSFDMKLNNKGSYVQFLWGARSERDEQAGVDDQFSGLRLSNNPLFPSGVFVCDGLGGFRSTLWELSLKGIPKGDWIHVEVTWGSEALQVRFNESQPQSFDYAEAGLTIDSTREGRIGFRGSRAAAIVDNLSVTHRIPDEGETGEGKADGSESTWREDFFNAKVFAASSAVSFVALLAFTALLSAAFHNQRTRKWMIALTSLAISALVAGVVVMKLTVRNYPDKDAGAALAQRSEATTEVLAQMQKTYEPQAKPSVRRVLFLGSSQTWGSGARYLNETWVARIQAALEADPESAGKIECINAGVQGIRSDEVLQLYQEQWLQLGAELVFVNLSNNDRHPQRLKQNLEELIRINREVGIATVLCLEANSPEKHVGDLPNHAVLRAVAQEQQVDLVELHQWLRKQSNTGLLWWDHVHPSSHGQRLMAHRMLPEVRQRMDL